MSKRVSNKKIKNMICGVLNHHLAKGLGHFQYSCLADDPTSYKLRTLGRPFGLTRACYHARFLATSGNIIDRCRFKMGVSNA